MRTLNVLYKTDKRNQGVYSTIYSCKGVYSCKESPEILRRDLCRASCRHHATLKEIRCYNINELLFR